MHTMSNDQQAQARCPIQDCGESLIYHEIFGGPASGNLLVIQITKHVYECPNYGLFAYLGNGKFSQIHT